MSLKGQRILIVDDDTTILPVWEIFFTQEGMYVHVANTPQVAINVYKNLLKANQKPEYVVLDAALSVRRTGFDVAREIHALDTDNYSTPIMLTGYAKDDLAAFAQEGAIKTGIEEVLSKPMDPDKLAENMIRIRERHLERKALMKSKGDKLQPSAKEVANELFKKLVCFVCALGLLGYIFWRETNEAGFRGEQRATTARILEGIKDEREYSDTLTAYIANLTNQLSSHGFKVDPMPERPKSKEIPNVVR